MRDEYDSRQVVSRPHHIVVVAVVLVTILGATMAMSLGNTTKNVDRYYMTDTKGSPQKAWTGHLAGAGASFINVTALWEDIWNVSSETSMHDLTDTLASTYGSRTWDIKHDRPSTMLSAAQQWVNTTLNALTQGRLWFGTTGQYQTLYAVQTGIGPSPRPAVLVTGILDSRYDTPGANDVGVSVAAVLETARILVNLSLHCDVYYVLSSTGRAGYDHDPGAAEFVQMLDGQGTEILTAISYDRLLFHRSQFPYGTQVLLRSRLESNIYQRTSWIPDLMIVMSADVGAGMVHSAMDRGYSEHSLAWELWNRNTSAVYASQGYFYDSLSGGIDDDADELYYSFVKAREAVASAAGAIMLLGRAGDGDILSFWRSRVLPVNGTADLGFVVSVDGFVNATVTWQNNATVYARIVSVSTGRTVYERTENDGLINLKYLANSPGQYRLVISNLGPDEIVAHTNVTCLDDADGDGLSDTYEVDNGLDPYRLDSDADGLEDDFEIAIGSDPRERDSDHDGALDSDEYKWGSSLVLQDSDGDNITDGEEAALGTSPILTDTDGDGISDYEEIYVYHSNPLSADTDGDGLDDAFEIATGLNATSIDTDGDGLDDLFEILNHINPLSVDTDGDGWTDAFEVYHYMSPTSTDTDGDLIPDNWDWNPHRHWVDSVAPVSVTTIVALLAVFVYLKRRAYLRGSRGVDESAGE